MVIVLKRLFFAISIPDEVKVALLKPFSGKQFHGVRWIPGEQLHITVHFIGEVHDEVTDHIHSVMPALCHSKINFDLGFENLQTVSNNKKPSIFWARLHDHPLFTDLTSSVQAILSPTEIKTQLPHITLARIRKLHQFPLVIPTLKPFSIPINTIELWESQLHETGSTYTITGSWKFGA